MWISNQEPEPKNPTLDFFIDLGCGIGALAAIIGVILLLFG